MTNGPADSDGREERLAEILAEFLEQMPGGNAGPPASLAARHPEFAEELTAFFAVREQFDAVVRPLRAMMVGLDSASPAPDREAADGPGRLGDFRLLREVGRGGMGVVYEAEQISLGRRVALKVLPLAATLDPRQLQRFKNEALAAAALDHPHVVDVYGVGCERGTHYYAMRFIDGHSLAQVVDHLRRVGRVDPPLLPDSVSQAFAAGPDPAAGSEGPAAAADTGPNAAAPTRRSSFPPSFFRSVAELGLHVADALDHAHGQGVIHRDIKPSNLLLDGQGKVWVADFGLARLDTAESLTGSGNLVGTLRYMAPEQALGRLPADHRADVYGLGVTLYELLTLRPAFAGGSREELLRQVASAEPPAPRRLDASIPADLETVILKASAKDPDERYPTARALADDLRRFLEDRPVQAQRPGPVARLRRWARRHRSAVLGTGAGLVLVLVLAVAGLAVNSILVSRERAKVQRQHEEAVANFQKARAAVDRMTRVAQEQLLDAPQMEQVRQELLQDAVTFYQDFLAERGDDPAVRQEAALAYGRLGNLQRYLGRPAEAEQNLQRAIDLLESEPALRPDARASLGEFHRCLGWLLESLRRNNESARAFERSVTILESLTAEFPAEPEYREQLSSSYISLANTVVSNRPGDAETIIRRVIALTEADARERYAHVLGHAALGALLARAGQPHEAERAYRRALEIEEDRPTELARRPDSRNRVGYLHLNLGGVLAVTGRSEAAERTYRRALACFEKLAADFPAVPYYRATLAATHSALADLLRSSGQARFADAETAYRTAIAIYQELRTKFPALPDYGRRLLGNHIQLGYVLVRAGRVDESREAFGQAMTLQGRLGPMFPGELGYLPDLARSFLDLGVLLAADGRKSEADDAYLAAVAVQEKAEAEFAGKPEARHDLALSHIQVARLLHSVERVEDEEKLCRWAVAHYQKLVEDAPDQTEYRDGLARVWLTLGIVLRHTGRLAEAEKACHQAVDHFSKLPDQPEYRQALANGYGLLGVVLREDRRPREAEPACEKAITLWEKLAADYPRQRTYRHQEANARNNFGYLLVENDQAPRAEPHHRKALKLFEALAGEDPDNAGYRDGQGMSHAGLSAAHFAAGRLGEAEKSQDRAIAFYRELVKSKPRPWYHFKLAEEQSNLANLLMAAGRDGAAVRALEEALAIQAKLAADLPKVARYPQAVTRTGNQLAWLLATGPDATVRDPQRAVKLAELAVSAAPNEGSFWNTLGVARYRAGDYKRAIEALEKSMSLRKGGDAFDWFVLAMAHHRLDQTDDARKWYDRAVEWTKQRNERLDKDKRGREELRRFHLEAEDLLDRFEPEPRGAAK